MRGRTHSRRRGRLTTVEAKDRPRAWRLAQNPAAALSPAAGAQPQGPQSRACPHQAPEDRAQRPCAGGLASQGIRDLPLQGPQLQGWSAPCLSHRPLSLSRLARVPGCAPPAAPCRAAPRPGLQLPQVWSPHGDRTCKPRKELTNVCYKQGPWSRLDDIISGLGKKDSLPNNQFLS